MTRVMLLLAAAAMVLAACSNSTTSAPPAGGGTSSSGATGGTSTVQVSNSPQYGSTPRGFAGQDALPLRTGHGQDERLHRPLHRPLAGAHRHRLADRRRRPEREPPRVRHAGRRIQSGDVQRPPPVPVLGRRERRRRHRSRRRRLLRRLIGRRQGLGADGDEQQQQRVQVLISQVARSLREEV